MYGSYDRTHSAFQNSDLMAKGPPSADEVALLEPFRSKLPAEVFGEPFVPPVSDGSGQDRALLRRAGQLLNEAGYPIKDGKRVGPNGERLAIEFLLEEPSFQPHHMPYIKNLGTLGIDASLRLIDSAQMQNRRNDFDYDLVIQRFSFSATPGELAAQLLLLAVRRDQGIAKPFRHGRSGDRCADRAGGRRNEPRAADDRLPGARPGDARRPLLDSPLVQGHALGCLLGHVQSSGAEAALRPRRTGDLVVRPRQGRQGQSPGLRQLNPFLSCFVTWE